MDGKNFASNDGSTDGAAASNLRESMARKKNVIYARFSSDLQSTSSCIDQDRQTREGLDRKGIDHRQAEVIYDEAISGTKLSRPGFMRIVSMMKRNEIGILAVDDLSRLTRSDSALSFINDVVYSGGRFISFGEGIDTNEPGWEITVQVMGFHNSTTIKELGRRVHRGQEGRLRSNLTAGDYPYGYESYDVNPVEHNSSRRGPKPEKNIRIFEQEARWVRQIFEWFISGWSLTKIKEELTRLGVERGHQCQNTNWSHQQVRRILANTKYVGQWVWGTTKTIRNSAGKIKQISVPSEDWIRIERPELRIIDQSVWEKAQQLLDDLQQTFGSKEGQKKRGPRVHHTWAYPSGLLNGLLVCQCGARLYSQPHADAKYNSFICPKSGKAEGTCQMRAHVSASKVKEAILSTVINMLTQQPEWKGQALAIMNQTLASTNNRVPLEIAANRKQLAEVQTQIDNLIDNMARGKNKSEAMFKRLESLESKLKSLREVNSYAEDFLLAPVRLPSETWIADQMNDLESLFEVESQEAALLLRKLIGKVHVSQVLPPGKSRGYVQIRFSFNGWAALSAVTKDPKQANFIEKHATDAEQNEGGLREFCIDIGGPTKMDQWAPIIAKWRSEGVKWKEIQERTGLGSGPAYVAWKRYVDSQNHSPNQALDPNSNESQIPSVDPIEAVT